jgi:hypothetical protein
MASDTFSTKICGSHTCVEPNLDLDFLDIILVVCSTAKKKKKKCRETKKLRHVEQFH